MASLPPAQCGCYACTPQLVPVSVTSQLKASCTPSTCQGLLWRKLIYTCCNNKDISVDDLEPSLQLLAELYEYHTYD